VGDDPHFLASLDSHAPLGANIFRFFFACSCGICLAQLQLSVTLNFTDYRFPRCLV
jgi:hypothetical protein